MRGTQQRALHRRAAPAEAPSSNRDHRRAANEAPVALSTSTRRWQLGSAISAAALGALLLSPGVAPAMHHGEAPMAGERAAHASPLATMRARVWAPETTAIELERVIQDVRQRIAVATEDDKASLHLLESSALLQLSKRKDRMTNARASFDELRAAVTIGRKRRDVAEAYGRTILAITQLNVLIRFFVGIGLAINLDDEVNTAAQMLEPHDDALSVLVRSKLAAASNDERLKRDARARLEALAQRAPADLEEAKRSLEWDAAAAKEAERTLR
jgi:hypothetical protein